MAAKDRNNLAKKQIDIIRESICVELKCLECRDLMVSGRMCFSVIEDFIDDRGKSCLFRLKEMSHDLFRSSETSGYKEKLYDMTVGYVFHEAMKLRENLYQIEYYRPHAEASADDLTARELKTVREIQSLLGKSQRELRHGLREIVTLLSRLMEQMKDLIKSYKDNYLLPRFLIENERMLTKVYGRQGFRDLVAELWSGGRVELLFRAAESYLESEFYEQARKLLKKVLDLDRDNGRARFLYSLSSAFALYYKSRYARALRLAEEAQALAPAAGPERQGRKLKHLIDDLGREMRRRKKGAVRTGGR